ncbi:MAG: SHOCT domain-containing protein [Vulcanimicrobiaceae bacterium]
MPKAFVVFFALYLPVVVLLISKTMPRSIMSLSAWWASYLIAELVLLGVPIAIALWLPRRKGPVYPSRILILTGMILVLALAFIVVPLGLAPSPDAALAFSIACFALCAILIVNRYVLLPWRRKTGAIMKTVKEFENLRERGLMSEEEFEEMRKVLVGK